jgi:ribonucleoside-diphosphate reductase alpha chain
MNEPNGEARGVTATSGSSRARGDHALHVRRTLTREGSSGLQLVEWSLRSVRITQADGRVAFALDDVEAPAGWSNLAVAVVARRYFATGPDGAPERSIRALVERVVRVIAAWGQAGGQVTGPGERDALLDELAALVLTQRATFATPVWLNVGLTERPLTSACFILKAEDSIPQLLDWNTREGLIFQQGGGAGINLSSVRSSREPVSRGGLASGPVSFMRATDAWAATIRAGGRARRGAKMVVLDASHPDILDFIEAKAREEDRGRALLAAGYPVKEVVASLAFQHANHSVRVSDEFMRLAIDGGEWPLRAVTTGEVLETLPARRLLSACAEAAFRCGDPGLLFADQIARWHTCPNAGPVTASNPCGEFLHVADSACNLATLNLLAFRRGRDFDIDGFTNAVELLVIAQDAIVDGSGYPSEAIERNAQRLRQIGIGYANLAALLMTLGIPYDSDQGRSWAAAVAALMTGVAYRRSAELAVALGPFAEFGRNREPMMRVMGRHVEALHRLGSEQPAAAVLSAARREWAQALKLGRRYGFRNAQTTLIPPTGTVSLMLDCETTGIEPYYALTTIKHFADGGEVKLSSRAVVDGLAVLGHSTATIEALSEYALDHGHLADAPGLRGDERLVFQTATGPGALSPTAHLQMVAAVQPFLSGGVSKTVPLPADTGVEAIEEIFITAWRLGLKSAAVYRDGSKLGQPLTLNED